jgi:predicted Zn-dependent protease
LTRRIRFSCLVGLLAGLPVADVTGAPFVPGTDQEVLETLPARAADPRMRELAALRRELAADPKRLDVAVRLARSYYEQAAAEGDPRYIGYAQAALAPWWDQPAPPEPARVMRAILLQFGHQFDAALADLTAVLQGDPGNGEAWAWQAAIQMVQARYPEARRACEALAPLAPPLISAACIANVDSVTGRATAAAAAIRAALRDTADAAPAERLWVLTRLAEIEERRGDYPAAEAAYREALALNITDGYLQAAYADFLLDRGRPAEVLVLLKDMTRSDLLLLRLALAAKALKAPPLAGWQGDLQARFDAARRRGDKLHQKEESRFELQLRGDAQRALALASENYTLQREPADARVLLEAALAARQPAAAAPVLRWMADSGVESAALRKLADALKGVS